MVYISTQEVEVALQNCVDQFEHREWKYTDTVIAGIPRGGVPVAYLLQGMLPGKTLTTVVSANEIEDRDQAEHLILVDDIYATGETIKRWAEHLRPDAVVIPFLKENSGGQRDVLGDPLITFGVPITGDEWVEFPWEVEDVDRGRPESAVRRLIEYLGHDLEDPHVADTPRRVLAFFDEMRERAKGEFTLTAFETKVDDLVVVRDIPFFSLCAHHMLPYHGTATVGYIPNGRVLGLSKVARIVAAQAAGLTVQEELARNIAVDVMKAVREPEASYNQSVAVVLRAVHTCMVMRGVRAVGSEMVTSSMNGKFRQEPDLRAEFLGLADRRV